MEKFWKWMNFWLDQKNKHGFQFTVTKLCKLKWQNETPQFMHYADCGVLQISDKNGIHQRLCQGSGDFREPGLDPCHRFPAAGDSSRLLYKKF